MEEFLSTHCSLCNKNSPLFIHIGHKINDNIFNMKLDEPKIKNIIKVLKENKLYVGNKPRFYKIMEYRYKNEIYTKMYNGISVYNYVLSDSCMEKKVYLRKLNNSSDNIAPQSIKEYDKIEEYELLNTIVENNLELEIRKYTDYYTCCLCVKGPIEKNKLINIINLIS